MTKTYADTLIKQEDDYDKYIKKFDFSKEPEEEAQDQAATSLYDAEKDLQEIQTYQKTYLEYFFEDVFLDVVYNEESKITR